MNSRPLRTAGLFCLALAALLSVWVYARHSPVSLTLGATRPLEARLAYALPYRPLEQGSKPGETVSLQTLSRLEAQGDLPGLAVGQLLRGDGDRARAALDALPRTPETLNQLAVVALLEGAPDQALDLTGQALAASPNFAPALWNRALAARDLGLGLTAAEGFEAVAALAEPGWSAEATERARAARAPVEARRATYIAALAHATEVVKGGPPLSEAEVRATPGVAREALYRALRAAKDRARALQLLPMAQLTDQVTGGRAMEAWVHWVADRDFGRRAPLARQAQAIHEGTLEGPALTAALAQLTQSGERDLILGALLDSGGIVDDAAHYDAAAAASEDPHFALLAQDQRSTAKIRMEGQYLEAERMLRRALETCPAAHDDAECAILESDLADLYTQLERLNEAWATTQRYVKLARANGEFFLERYGMETSAAISRFRYTSKLAAAMFHEALVMTPDDCGVQQDVASQMINSHVVDLDWDAASEDLRQTHDCPNAPIPLLVAQSVAALYRVKHLKDDLEKGRAIIAGSRGYSPAPGYRAWGDYVEAMLDTVDDPAGARAKFRAVVAQAEQLPPGDADRVRLRSYASLELILEAASRQAFDEALALFAQEQRSPLPAACSLAVAADDERVLAIAVGADGHVSGAFDRSRTAPLIDASQVVPTSLQTTLTGCRQVSVLARAPLHGQARLLPPSFAWSYRVPTKEEPARPAPLPPRRVVVSNVTPPASLGLPRLAPWRAEAVPGQPLLELTGAAATPSRVLAELADATEIELHAHGFIDLAFSEASLIALSEEPGGRYALTAGDLRTQKLRGAPTVLLAACDTAHAAPQEQAPWSLPVAFVEAGARAVFATRSSIPDSEAATFFSALGKRLREGQAPTEALRDERQQWLARAPDSWVQNVVLFE